MHITDVVNIILKLGFVPSTASMAQIMKQLGKPISKQGIYSIYIKLEEDGVIKDTKMNPRWTLAACPYCNRFYGE